MSNSPGKQALNDGVAPTPENTGTPHAEIPFHLSTTVPIFEAAIETKPLQMLPRVEGRRAGRQTGRAAASGAFARCRFPDPGPVRSFRAWLVRQLPPSSSTGVSSHALMRPNMRYLAKVVGKCCPRPRDGPCSGDCGHGPPHLCPPSRTSGHAPARAGHQHGRYLCRMVTLAAAHWLLVSARTTISSSTSCCEPEQQAAAKSGRRLIEAWRKACLLPRLANVLLGGQ